MLLKRPGIFLHFRQNSVFFACSCIWAVCGITTPRYQIPRLTSHLKQHKLLQASCGVFWGSVTETPLHRLKSLTSHTAWAFQRDMFLLISILSAFPARLALLAFLIWDHMGKKEQFPNRVTWFKIYSILWKQVFSSNFKLIQHLFVIIMVCFSSKCIFFYGCFDIIIIIIIFAVL